MPNKPLADWKKIVIMVTTPYFGNRTVAKKADCSVWAVRKYRNRMRDQQNSLDIEVSTDEHGEPMVDEQAMSVIDEIVQEGLDQGRGRI